MNLEFSRQIFKKYSNFMKICPVEACCIHADEQTCKHEEASSQFSQFCKVA